MPPPRTRNPRHVPLALLLIAVLSAAPLPRLAARGTPARAVANLRLREWSGDGQSPRTPRRLEGDERAAPSQTARGGGAAAAQRPREVALDQAILAAEDSRAEDEGALAPIREGLKGDPRLQALAVRALGRFERASLVPEIAAMLDSPVVAVRVEAANALGQAVLRDEPGPASIPLTTRARTESDARVLAAIARTLGRLPYQQESEIRDAERTILAIADRAATSDETIVLAGVAHGLDALARRAAKLGSLSADARSRLRKLARQGLAAGGSGAGATTGESVRAAAESAARVRRLAVSALVTARESNVPLLREVLRDPDEQVRRLGVVWLGATEDVPLRDEAFRQAFGDPAAMVRYEVLRTYARVRQTTSIGSASPSAGTTASATGTAQRSGTWGTTTPPIPGPTPLDAASSASTPPAAAGDSPAGECALEVKALDDANANVGLLAIDLLGRCGERQMATDRLTAIVSAFFDGPRSGVGGQRDAAAPAPAGARSPATSPARAPQDARARADTRAQDGTRRDPSAPPNVPQTWHRPAHALVALARLAPDRATGWLARAAAHDLWYVRLYAARAAGVMKDRATLDALAADGQDNVREAAIEALQALVGHEADAQYLAALDRSDPQLLRTAARALAGTSQKTETADRVLKTFVRISAAQRETSRDVRLALLDTLDALGRASDGKSPDEAVAPGAPGAPAENAIDLLRPSLRDFDPVVARRVAAMLTAWTGQSQAPAPTRLPSAAVPSPREIERLSRTRAVVRMARGGTFTLALRADVAPTNVARFVRLARAGTFNGLTFHRVEPNFVLQGGSPGANEYAGDGPFTRDELDLTSNLRGTIGLSTRGRDTGDGQFYVNLVDNVRLDHNYTVFAEIVEGLPLIDEILEGDVISRIELRELAGPR